MPIIAKKKSITLWIIVLGIVIALPSCKTGGNCEVTCLDSKCHILGVFQNSRPVQRSTLGNYILAPGRSIIKVNTSAGSLSGNIDIPAGESYMYVSIKERTIVCTN